jgi:hypothetical protein
MVFPVPSHHLSAQQEIHHYHFREKTADDDQFFDWTK